ncbi:hypothetical protein DVA86_24935 [Streptomyces armeniacus]|uniref:Pyrrolo-quinoline quinone repeat domain-containing protein n=1 Tax=Streptomyces armeniacus TaxID=83291 RepID=A0A345XUU4_9ACTN|nr:PQQ-binding-like beta-propeller repeat protein [Streptomyces armeniacus]AXK35410.1 hypothetical protein DVA86_24935 [Streptomyces armeniacus]
MTQPPAPNGPDNTPYHPPYNPPPQPGWQGPNPYAGGQQPAVPGMPPAPPTLPPRPPGGPGGPGGRRRGVMAAVVTAVVAALLAGGGWLVFAPGDDGGGGGGESKGKPSAPPKPEYAHKKVSSIAWQAPAPKGKIVDHQASESPGIWFNGDSVIKPELKEIKAYGREKGDVRWKVAFPGDICGSRTGPKGGFIVLTYESGGVCNKLTAVDTRSHKQTWTKDLPAKYANGDKVEWAITARTDESVIVGHDGRLTAYGAADGEEQWQRKLSGGWQVQYLAGDDSLLATVFKESGGTTSYEVRRLDPDGGSTHWSWAVPAGKKPMFFASKAPVVIGLGYDTHYIESEFITLDEKGKLRSRVSIVTGNTSPDDDVPKRKYLPNCTYADYGCNAAVVAHDTLYLPTDSVRSSGSLADDWRENKIVAFDLSDGRIKWSRPVGTKRSGLPVGVDGGNLIVYVEPTRESGGQLRRFTPENGESSLYQRHPDSQSETELEAYGWPGTPISVYFDRGQFFTGYESLGGSEKFMLTAFE